MRKTSNPEGFVKVNLFALDFHFLDDWQDHTLHFGCEEDDDIFTETTLGYHFMYRWQTNLSFYSKA